MLDRKVVREFLDEELKEIEIPEDIFKEEEKQRDGSSFDNALVNNRITSLCLI